MQGLFEERYSVELLPVGPRGVVSERGFLQAI